MGPARNVGSVFIRTTKPWKHRFLKASLIVPQKSISRILGSGKQLSLMSRKSTNPQLCFWTLFARSLSTELKLGPLECIYLPKHVINLRLVKSFGLLAAWWLPVKASNWTREFPTWTDIRDMLTNHSPKKSTSWAKKSYLNKWNSTFNLQHLWHSYISTWLQELYLRVINYLISKSKPLRMILH